MKQEEKRKRTKYNNTITHIWFWTTELNWTDRVPPPVRFTCNSRAIREAKGRWNDGVMVGWPEKKRRAEKQRRNEAKKKEAEKREEIRSKQSKSRILSLLMGKLSNITKSLIFQSQYHQTLRKTLKGSRHFEDRQFQLRGATKSGKCQKLTSAKCRIAETFVVHDQN